MSCTDRLPCSASRHSGLRRAELRHLTRRLNRCLPLRNLGKTFRSSVADGTVVSDARRTRTGTVGTLFGRSDECSAPNSSSAQLVRSPPGSSHTRHDRARFTANRRARASFLLASRSRGTCSPRPKYISSGVWPRNAECGSWLLCSVTYHADPRIMPISVVECCSWWGSLAWSWHNHIASRKARIGSGGR